MTRPLIASFLNHLDGEVSREVALQAYREAVEALFGLDGGAVECAIAWLGAEGGGAAIPVPPVTGV